MLAVGPAMDRDYPQHEPPPAGSLLYSPPPLQVSPAPSPAHPTGLMGACPALSAQGRGMRNAAPEDTATST